jgi:hypothetical protein
VLTFDEHRDPACTEHPHCVCGAPLDDDGSPSLVCPECSTGALVEGEKQAEVAR